MLSLLGQLPLEALHDHFREISIDPIRDGDHEQGE